MRGRPMTYGEGDAHQPAVSLAPSVELIELGLADLGVIFSLVVMPYQRGIVQLGGIGNTEPTDRT